MKDNQSIDCAVYERPAVNILEFSVESGFESSPGDEGMDYSITGNSDAGILEDGGTWN